MRTGLIARKLGMMQIFNSAGGRVPVTVLKIDPCKVVDRRVQDKDGYTAVCIGSEAIPSRKLTKPMVGYFEKKSMPGFRHLKEFRVSEDNLLDVGSDITAAHFAEGQFVDVTGTSVGKGFAGPMKRHNFGGLRASHGVSVVHRSHGSTGNRTSPGRVFKNKKMAGHMGAERVTVLNLKVVSVDPEKGVVFVKGAVPGSKNGVVWVRDAIKKTNKKS